MKTLSKIFIIHVCCSNHLITLRNVHIKPKVYKALISHYLPIPSSLSLMSQL